MDGDRIVAEASPVVAKNDSNSSKRSIRVKPRKRRENRRAGSASRGRAHEQCDEPASRLLRMRTPRKKASLRADVAAGICSARTRRRPRASSRAHACHHEWAGSRAQGRTSGNSER